MSLIELYNGSREMGTLPALVLNVFQFGRENYDEQIYPILTLGEISKHCQPLNLGKDE